MKNRNKLALQLRGKINKQVAAAQQIEAGKRRIFGKIVNGKNYQLAHLFFNVVEIIYFMKVFMQPLFRNIGNNIVGINSGARAVYASPVNIGGKDLDLVRFSVFDFFEAIQ